MRNKIEKAEKKPRGQVGIQDPKDELREALGIIKPVWEELNYPATYDNSAIVVAIVTYYAKLLNEQKPKRIDTKKLFDIRE